MTLHPNRRIDDTSTGPGAFRRLPSPINGMVFACFWLALIAVLAVGAPFLAAGTPLISITQDLDSARAYSFPLFTSLSACDYVLVACAAALVIPFLVKRFRRWTMRILLFVGTITLACLIVSAGHDRTRMALPIPPASHSFAQSVYPPVPWWPSERLNDRNCSLLPPGSSSESGIARLIERRIAQLPEPIAKKSLTPGLFDNLPLDAQTKAELSVALAHATDSQASFNRSDLLRDINRILRQSGRPYILGTDSLGQDVLSQLIHGCRLALTIGLVSTAIAATLGVLLGGIMGILGGIVDFILMRIVEVFMSVPLLFILVVAAGVMPRNTYVMMVIIGCFTWTGAATFVRAELLRVREQDYVAAARATALPERRILFRHMLPNALAPVIIDCSFAVAGAILIEATLSFLGLGPPDQPSWGRVLADGVNEAGELLWWLAVPPGLAIFLTVLSLTVFGERLRESLDPRIHAVRTPRTMNENDG